MLSSVGKLLYEPARFFALGGRGPMTARTSSGESASGVCQCLAPDRTERKFARESDRLRAVGAARRAVVFNSVRRIAAIVLKLLSCPTNEYVLRVDGAGLSNGNCSVAIGNPTRAIQEAEDSLNLVPRSEPALRLPCCLISRVSGVRSR